MNFWRCVILKVDELMNWWKKVDELQGVWKSWWKKVDELRKKVDEISLARTPTTPHPPSPLLDKQVYTSSEDFLRT